MAITLDAALGARDTTPSDPGLQFRTYMHRLSPSCIKAGEVLAISYLMC